MSQFYTPPCTSDRLSESTQSMAAVASMRHRRSAESNMKPIALLYKRGTLETSVVVRRGGASTASLPEVCFRR